MNKEIVTKNTKTMWIMEFSKTSTGKRLNKTPGDLISTENSTALSY